jgi:high-affinity nickel-transport protein
MGHSTIVVLLALVVALAAGSVRQSDVDNVKVVGGLVALCVAMVFLLVVATLNGAVLRTLLGLWRRVRHGEIVDADVERALSDRGLLNRLMGGRMRALIRSSWHMYPVGLLMGLGLETASEVTLLGLAASTASGGTLPLLGALSLPLLFAAGMSAFDTADSLLMTRAYSWSYRNPVRTLFYNTATTAATVAIAVFVCAVYFANVLATYAGLRWLTGLGHLSDQFEYFGYAIACVFVLSWGTAMVWWKARGHDRRYPAVPTPTPAQEMP